jgi:autotransporter translocation and assembly factor TamB
MFTIGVVTGIYFWTSLPEQQFNQWIGYYLSAKTGYRITIEKINRDLWNKIELDNIAITFESENQNIPIAKIKHAETHYSIKGLLAREINLNNFEISGVSLNVLFDENKHLAIPRKTAKTSTDEKPSGIPSISINDYKIDSVEINLNFPDISHTINIPVLKGSVEADNSKFSAIIDSLQIEYPEKNMKIDSCSAEISYADGELQIAKLGIKSDFSRITLSGNIHNLKSPEFNLDYNFAPLKFEEITKLTGVKLSGDATMKGRISGNISEFEGNTAGDMVLFDYNIRDFSTKYHFKNKRIEFSNFTGLVFEAPLAGGGYLDFNSNPAQYGYRGTVTELNLQNIGLTLYSMFTGDVTLTGRGLSEKNMKMQIDMHLYKADIDIYHFHEAIGKIEFDLHKLTFFPEFKARYKDTWLTYEGYLEYTGQIAIEADIELANLANFQNQFFITDLDGRGSAHVVVSGPTLDFSVVGDFSSDSCRFYGMTSRDCKIDLNLGTFITHQTGTVKGIIRAGELYTIPVDTSYFTISVAGDKYFLDRVYCRNANNILEFSGLVDNTLLPPSFTVDTMRTILWDDTVYSAHPMDMDIDSTLVRFKDFVLAYKTGRVEMVGAITYENEMDLDIKANGFEISPIVKYFNFNRKLMGVLSGRMAVTGNFDLPVIGCDFTIDDFAIDSVVQGDFQVKALYSDRLLEVPSAEIIGEGLEFQMSGKFPMELSFTFTGDRFPESPFTAHVSASGTDLPIVPVFVPSVDYVRGNYSASIDFSGTFSRPLASGTFSIADGTVKALELVDPISGINISGRMENDLIHIDQITAFITQSKANLGRRFDGYPLQRKTSGTVPGKIEGSGTIKLLGIGLFDYNLKLAGKDCEFYTESYDIHGLADMNLSVTGSSPPVVMGTIELTRLDMKEPFGTFYIGITEKTEILEDSTMWDLAVDIVSPNNLWIKNPDADMEMMGTVRVLRNAGIRNLLGELEIIRGNFFLFNYKFKIKSGQMVFQNISVLDPQVNFNVSTRVRETATSGLMNQTNLGYEDLDLLITGTLSKPEIRSANDSLYSDENVLRTLVADRFGVTTAQGKNGGFGEKLLANMLDVLYNQTNRIPVFDEIDISPNADSLGQTQVSVAKYLSPKLFLRYSRRGLSQTTGETIGIEYMFNNNLSFEGRQGTKNEGISFDLKLKYEF